MNHSQRLKIEELSHAFLLGITLLKEVIKEMAKNNLISIFFQAEDQRKGG